MGIFSQLGLILRKNLLFRVRQPGILFLEIAWPVVFFTIAVLLRQAALPVQKNECEYAPRAMPSAGVMPFMQSFVCNINNKCQQPEEAKKATAASARLSTMFNSLQPLMPKEGEKDTIISSLPKAIEVLEKMQEMLETPDVKKLIDMDLSVGGLLKDKEKVKDHLTNTMKVLSPSVVDAILSSKINLTSLYNMTGYIDFKGIVCSEKKLKEHLQFSVGINVTLISKGLCAINSSLIPGITEEFQKEIDIVKIMDIASQMAGLVGDVKAGTAIRDIATMVEVLTGTELFKSLLGANLDTDMLE